MADDLPAVIIGPGATGGLLAATLQRAGMPVSLLCRDAGRARRLRRTGISVAGATELRVPGGRFRGISHDPRALGPARAVFLCVKSYDAPAAIRAARALADGPAVSLLNGLAHVPLFRRLLPPRLAVYGVGYFSAFRTGPGAVHHAGGRRIRLAQDAPGGAAAAARDLLRRAGWTVDLAPSVDRLLWTKLVLNAAINPLAALAGRVNGGLAAEPALADLVARAAAEGERVLEAGGIEPLESPLPEFALRLCRGTADNVNSMLADLRAGRRTEAASILEPLLDAARRRRVPAPTLSSLYRWTRALETSLLASPPATRDPRPATRSPR